ncbi:AIR1 domain-containing protein [Golovinomyces cichoracearum]|uniref:AIR1 domain-containing protein n=1 Tax=Golovinomyces cichoracearum TaxID=62708 RepID=A0A420HPS9_9PEZI|nr:AIR1 domain-containing protein [Golovinomyces cichoracearum]
MEKEWSQSVRGHLNLGRFRKCITVLKELDGVLKAVEKLRKMEEKKLQSVSTLEERIIALEKMLRKSLEAIPQKSRSLAVEAAGKRSYASVVAPKMEKIVVRMRVAGAEGMQPRELLSVRVKM